MTEEEFSLSICILFYDRDFHFLDERINEIYNKVKIKDYEIILIDNRDDKSVEIPKYDKVKYFSMIKNTWAWTGRLAALKHVTKRYVWFIDIDDNIGEITFDDVKNLSANTSIGFCYNEFNTLKKWSRINCFFFLKSHCDLAYFELLNEANKKVSYFEDIKLRSAIENNLNSLQYIDKAFYFVNRTETSGRFSKPFRSLEDYKEMFSDLSFVIMEDSHELEAEILINNILKELSQHDDEFRKEVLNLYKTRLLQAKKPINYYLKILFFIAQKYPEYKWVLSSTKAATL